MDWTWLALALVLALGDWMAVAVGKNKLRVVTKPGVMLALITGFTLAGGWQGETYWFGLALAFSLAGDVMLMLPPGFFTAGLAFFLIGHILYILGFSQGLILPGWSFVILIAILMAVDVLMYRRVSRAVLTRPKGRWILFPLQLYQVVISLMVMMALTTLWRSDWPRLAAWLVSTGALLFFTSDMLLANDRFVNPIRGGKLLVIITYHLGQVALISGALLRG